jgi:hypothetical protein
MYLVPANRDGSQYLLIRHDFPVPASPKMMNLNLILDIAEWYFNNHSVVVAVLSRAFLRKA